MDDFEIKPEYVSMETFVQFLTDDDRTVFTHEDLQELAVHLQICRSKIRSELEGYGLKLGVREIPKRVRGFTTSSNDRWFGPGSSKTHGGAAYTGMMIKKYGSKDTPFG